MTDIEQIENLQKLFKHQNIESEKRIAEVEAREREVYGNIIRKLTAKDILQKLVDNFEHINSESISTLAKEYGVEVKKVSNKVATRPVDINVRIRTLGLVSETDEDFIRRLIWSSSIPKDKFSELLDGSLKGIKETILSCLYGESNE